MTRVLPAALIVAVGVVVLLTRSTEPEAGPPQATPSATEAPGTSAGPTRPGNGVPTDIPDDAQPATVTSITDGDTLRVDIADSNQPVRLLELDTPEVSGDCGASKATDALTRLAPVGSQVRLEADVEGRDRYGRLLRYLWRDDGTLVNEELVRQGWARAKLYPPNDRYWPVMQRAEQQARDGNAGLWGLCNWDLPAGATAPPASTPDAERCDPNYSGCVPIHPPDVDCSRVDGPVTILRQDPHNLDGDGDRRACEPAPS